MKKISSVAGFTVYFALCGAAWSSDQYLSDYTSLALEKNCRLVSSTAGGQTDEEAQGAEWWCDGYDGKPVWVGEGDLRYFLGYGRDAKEQCSARQTLSAFNTIGETLEWRLLREFPGHVRPVATILRYRTDSDGNKGQYLVVTKLGTQTACHMAYVDVKRSRDANVLARKAADTYAQGFDCRSDRPFVMTWSGPQAQGAPGGGGCSPD